MWAFIHPVPSFPLVFLTPHLALPVCDFSEKEYLTLIIISLLCSKLFSMDSTCVQKDVNRYSGKEGVLAKTPSVWVCHWLSSSLEGHDMRTSWPCCSSFAQASPCRALLSLLTLSHAIGKARGLAPYRATRGQRATGPRGQRLPSSTSQGGWALLRHSLCGSSEASREASQFPL